jgi:hypothetical protein
MAEATQTHEDVGTGETGPVVKAIEPGEVVQTIADLPDQLRQEIVTAREAGTTLAELKKNFGRQVAYPVIKAVAEPVKKASAPKPDPQPKASKYVEDPNVIKPLADRITAVRQHVGQAKIASECGVMPFAIWRAERRHQVTADEVEPITAGLTRLEARIEAGEFAKADRTPKAKAASKADLTHRIDTVTKLLHDAHGDSKIGKTLLIESALAILDPQVPTE